MGKALCPAYPNCDNALLAEYDKIYKASTLSAPAGGPQAPVSNSNELPCANYPFCDVNHAALAQGVPCANFPNCDVHHVAIAQRGKRQAAAPVTQETFLDLSQDQLLLLNGGLLNLFTKDNWHIIFQRDKLPLQCPQEIFPDLSQDQLQLLNGGLLKLLTKDSWLIILERDRQLLQ